MADFFNKWFMIDLHRNHSACDSQIIRPIVSTNKQKQINILSPHLNIQTSIRVIQSQVQNILWLDHSDHIQK